MSPRDEGAFEQMQERIQNVLTALNTYRARNLGDARIESFMTQLERVLEVMESGGWFMHEEMKGFDFHLTEGTVLEGNEQLGRELYSIRNFVENKM